MNKQKIVFKEVEDNIGFTNVPFGGMQLYNPKYRELSLEGIIKQSNIFKEYVPWGYNYYILVRSTGTIHAYQN